MPSLSDRPRPPRPQRPTVVKGRRPQRPQRPDTAPLDPLAQIEQDTPSTGDMETDLTAEQLAVKAQLQAQDKAQRKQFRDIYDTGFYYVDCYDRRATRDRAQAIQARLLGLGGDDVKGLYRDGFILMQGYEALARRLGVDISDL